jgi:hypothetical protein
MDAPGRALRKVVDGLRTKWGSFPERLTDIPGIRYKDLGELRTAIQQGRVVLQRFSVEYGYSIFALFARPAERAYLQFLSAISVLGPVAGIVLAFTSAWWWIIPGILTAVLGMREHTRAYNTVIYRGAVSSELAFCFLYRVKHIYLTWPDQGRSLHWKD